MKTGKLLQIFFIMTLVTVLIPERLAACSVCYGAAGTTALAGMNMSILFLLALTYLVLGGFAFFFFHLRKREKLFTEGPQEKSLSADHSGGK